MSIIEYVRMSRIKNNIFDNYMNMNDSLNIILSSTSTNHEPNAKLSKVFGESLRSGNIETTEWIITTFDHIDPLEYNDTTFIYYARIGKLDICKFLHQIIQTKFNKLYYLRTYNDAFIEACANGHLDVAMWIIDIKIPIDIHLDDDKAFRFSCANGHLAMAKYVYKLDHLVDAHAGDEYAFIWSCLNGYLDVSMWLWKKVPDIQLDMYDHIAFKKSCEYDNLKVAMWLMTICGSYYVIVKAGKIVNWNIFVKDKSK